MTVHEPNAPGEPADKPITSTEEVVATAAHAPSLRSKRKRPLRTMSLSPEGWERLEEFARRWGLSCSRAVERLIRDTTMPRGMR